MTTQYGPLAMTYFVYKSMIFNPSSNEALAGLIEHLNANNPDSLLLKEAEKFIDDSSELEFDFNRMCIGPYKLLVAPYEGVYRSGNHVINTDETVRVAEFYQHIGLVIDEKLNEPADFIGNELEFLYCVHALADEQRSAGNIQNHEELTAIADEFISKHLGTWITPFCEGIKHHAQQAFWREFATELHLFISQQIQ